jgi:UDP-N-acetylmuramyl pentapeptide phosphotransferase/UDP-N-acetylglucosamine-1-phosphate transferase
MQNLFLYIVCLLTGAGGALLIIRFGFKLNIVDIPNDRSSHTNVVPKGGGIGIVAGFIISAKALSFPAGFWIPAICLAIVSFSGDMREISAKIRLIIQFICSIIFLTNLFYLRRVQPEVYLLIFPLAVFVVGTTNFYNFMDGIDGIAGITGVTGFGLLSVYAYVTGAEPEFVVFNTAIGLSCIGFLYFNFPKAKVFMGDVGSILLGFVFAGMVILLSDSFIDFICLGSFLFPFYADELTTMIVRIKAGEKLSAPHRRHLYQLFANEYGFAHWKVSAGYGIGQLFVGATLLFAGNKGITVVLFLLLFYFGIFSAVSYCFRLAAGSRG